MAHQTRITMALQNMQTKMHKKITDGCSLLLQEMNQNLVSLVNLTVSNVEGLEESLREDIILVENQISVELDGTEKDKHKTNHLEKDTTLLSSLNKTDDWMRIQELAKEKLKEIYIEMNTTEQVENEPIDTPDESKSQMKLVHKPNARPLSNVIEHKAGKEQHVKKRGRRRNSSNDGSNEVIHPPSPKIRRKMNGNNGSILYSELPQAQQYNSMPSTSSNDIARQEKDGSSSSLAFGLSEIRGRPKSRKPRIHSEVLDENRHGYAYSEKWICDTCSMSNGAQNTSCTECSSTQSQPDNSTRRSCEICQDSSDTPCRECNFRKILEAKEQLSLVGIENLFQINEQKTISTYQATGKKSDSTNVALLEAIIRLASMGK